MPMPAPQPISPHDRVIAILMAEVGKLQNYGFDERTIMQGAIFAAANVVGMIDASHEGGLGVFLNLDSDEIAGSEKVVATIRSLLELYTEARERGAAAGQANAGLKR